MNKFLGYKHLLYIFIGNVLCMGIIHQSITLYKAKEGQFLCRHLHVDVDRKRMRKGAMEREKEKQRRIDDAKTFEEWDKEGRDLDERLERWQEERDAAMDHARGFISEKELNEVLTRVTENPR